MRGKTSFIAWFEYGKAVIFDSLFVRPEMSTFKGQDHQHSCPSYAN